MTRVTRSTATYDHRGVEPARHPRGPLLLTTDGAALTAVYFERHRDGADGRPAAARRTGRPRRRAPRAGRGAHPAGGVLRRASAASSTCRSPRRARPSRSGSGRRCSTSPTATTASYGDVARRLGLLPSASRAVGLANGSNPISIIVPCHRVIGADGSLTGYGGGLDRKRYLLDLERDLLF